MRRILLLITDLEIGGTPTVVRELALRLRDDATHVEVACLKGWGPVADQLKLHDVTVSAFGMSHMWQLPSAVKELRERVTSHQIDTVVSFLMHANVVAAMASRRMPEGRWLQSIQTVQTWPRWHWPVQRIAQHAAERIMVPSTAVAKAAEQRCGVEPARISVIPNAIEPSQFSQSSVFQREAPRVGFIGRLDPVKLVPQIVLAITHLKDRPDIELHIFGEGPDRGIVEQIIKLHRLEKRVFLHGRIARPQEALGQIDLLVQPSPHEGFGLVLIEAMASGVPVIAADSGGATDILHNEVNGLTVQQKGVDRNIASALQRLIDEPELRRRLIENGLKTVREQFTWDVVLPQYRRLLKLDRA